MTKNKPLVEFQGKEMNLLEARLYLIGLNFGLVKTNLNEEEEKDYTRWKNIRNNRNEIAQKLVKEKVFRSVSEKEYLIESLEDKIESTKIAIKKVYCETHGGHKEKKGSEYVSPSIGRVVTHYQCARCGITYEKNASEKINNPFRG